MIKVLMIIWAVSPQGKLEPLGKQEYASWQTCSTAVEKFTANIKEEQKGTLVLSCMGTVAGGTVTDAKPE